MRVTLKINKQTTQIEQIAKAMGMSCQPKRLEIPPVLGKGFLQYYALPYDIQVHHYQYQIKQEIEVVGENWEEDGLYMLHVNLSTRVLRKNIGEGPVVLSQAGGSGALFYSPGYNSQGKNEVDQAYEIVIFSFPKETLKKWKDWGEKESKLCL